MKKLRTRLRGIYVICLILFGSVTDERFLYAGVCVLVAAAALHFLACGYLKKERELITAGPYAFVRNPFYVANFFLDLGLGLIVFHHIVVPVYMALFYLIVIPRRARMEESSLAAIFGREYEQYQKLVYRFVPFVGAMPKELRKGRFSAQVLINNQEIPRAINSLNLPPLLLVGTGIRDSGLTPDYSILAAAVCTIYLIGALLRRYLKRYKK